MVTSSELIDHFGGVARGRQLAPFGFPRRRLADDVAHSEIIRIRPGVFTTASTPRLIQLAAGHGGALTCAHALRHHGVWVLNDDEQVHVWMGLTGRVHHDHCTCVAHFRPGRMSLGVADVEHALVHAYACHGAELFFCALESAWNKHLVGSAARARIRTALPSAARWLMDFAHGDSESGLESLVRLRLHLEGIDVQAQVSLPGVGRVDFVIGGRVILEADGQQNHEGPSMRHKDLVRDAAASTLGYESLHFDYAMIVHHWDVVLPAILAALARARA